MVMPRIRRKRADADAPIYWGPFALYVEGSFDPEPATKDLIFVEVSAEDGMFWASLPQFGLEFCARDAVEVLETELPKRLLSFYAGLRELPSDFINEVELVQIELIERHFLPWLGHLFGKNPSYLVPPPSEDAHTAEERLGLVNA
jgi:hypothetical protein